MNVDLVYIRFVCRLCTNVPVSESSSVLGKARRILQFPNENPDSANWPSRSRNDADRIRGVGIIINIICITVESRDYWHISIKTVLLSDGTRETCRK